MNKHPYTLNINPDTICFIINSVQEFQAKESVTFPEDMPNSDYEYDSLQILADHQDDLTFLEAKKVISDLEPDQKMDLLALLYLGRGDYDIREWVTAQKEAINNMPSELAEYLFSKPQLSEYLSKGLEEFGCSCD